ncbi:MAG: hypothetical protein ACJAT3_000927 [Akkermansiaceae bacterium]|jgi:hypothetical protein
MSGLKKCPYCAEEIMEEAVKCRYCHEFLDESKRPVLLSTEGDPLPLYLRSSFILVTFLFLPPLALPLIWLHPKLHIGWKVGLSLVIGVFCWMSYAVYQGLMLQLDETMKMLDGGF